MDKELFKKRSCEKKERFKLKGTISDFNKSQIWSRTSMVFKKRNEGKSMLKSALVRRLTFLFLLLLSPGLTAKAIMISSHKDAHCFNPTWSAAADKIVYEKVDIKSKDIELFISHILEGPRNEKLKIKGLNESSASLRRLGIIKGEVSIDFSWSPKIFNQFLISSNLKDSNYNLFLNDGTMITKHKAHDGSPVWSPNGKKLIFVSGRSGEGDLYLKQSLDIKATARRVTFTKRASELYPVFHPSSQKVAYILHNAEGDKIHELDLRNLRTKQLLKSNLIQYNPSYSPDGKSLAFYGKNRKDDFISIYHYSGGKLKLLAKNVIKSDKKGPVFTPDSRAIVYVKKDPKTYDPIQMVSLKTGVRVDVSTGTQHNQDLDIVVDGNKSWWLAFVAQGSKKDSLKRYNKLYIYEMLERF